MDNRLSGLCLGLAIFLFASPGFAHHSGAVYDKDKLATVTGTVVKLEWTNPHIITRLTVTTDKGDTEQWVILGGSVRSMHGGGWNSQILKPGDVITASGHPHKDGRKIMEMLRVVRLRPDPKELPATSVEKYNYELFLKNQREGKKTGESRDE